MTSNDSALEYLEKAIQLERDDENACSTACAKRQSDDVLKYYEQALTIKLRISDNQEEIANILTNIGSVLSRRGKFEEVRKTYECALQMQLECLPSMHPSIGTSYFSIAGIHLKKQQYEHGI